jgi:hypothetical protein
MNGKSIESRREVKIKEEKEERLLNIMRRRVFLDELKSDLMKLENEFKDKEKEARDLDEKDKNQI